MIKTRNDLRDCIPVQLALFQRCDRGRTWLEEPCRAVHNRLEYRLHVRRRTGDDLQDIGGGRLSLQRFLGLVEQARILDGDNGLIGEALQQLDVVVGERAGLHPRNADHPDGHPIAQ
jgi:hypothetical protein